MNQQNIIGAVVALIAIWLTTESSFGQFEINGYNIDTGGGAAIGGTFAIESTIGQADAGTDSVGGPFTLSGGFQTSEAIRLGDVNGDGEIDLLDVAPFVTTIASSDFIPEADINQDGVVNLLDVDPFVELLLGG